MHVVPFGFPAGNNRHPGICLHSQMHLIFLLQQFFFFLSQALLPTVLECAPPSASLTIPELEKDAVEKNRKASRDTVEIYPV